MRNKSIIHIMVGLPGSGKEQLTHKIKNSKEPFAVWALTEIDYELVNDTSALIKSMLKRELSIIDMPTYTMEQVEEYIKVIHEVKEGPVDVIVNVFTPNYEASKVNYFLMTRDVESDVEVTEAYKMWDIKPRDISETVIQHPSYIPNKAGDIIHKLKITNRQVSENYVRSEIWITNWWEESYDTNYERVYRPHEEKLDIYDNPNLADFLEIVGVHNTKELQNEIIESLAIKKKEWREHNHGDYLAHFYEIEMSNLLKYLEERGLL